MTNVKNIFMTNVSTTRNPTARQHATRRTTQQVVAGLVKAGLCPPPYANGYIYIYYIITICTRVSTHPRFEFELISNFKFKFKLNSKFKSLNLNLKHGI